MPFTKGHTINLGKKRKPHTKETKIKISIAQKERLKINGSWQTGLKLPNRSGENHHWFGRDNSDDLNPTWKGENVGYRGLHLWVESKLGKPETCEICFRSNLKGRKIHWANLSGEYKRILTDWIRLCAKCHKEYDIARRIPQLALQ